MLTLAPNLSQILLYGTTENQPGKDYIYLIGTVNLANNTVI